MKTLAIVGAGPAGLAAAWKLRDSDWESTIFEKSRGLCGRATSRTRHGARLDPGANYLKAESRVVKDLLFQKLPTDELVEIPGDIWTFDGSNTLTPGDPEQNKEPKWTYRSGISTLGKLLAEAADCSIQRETRIQKLLPSSGGWNLLSTDGALFEGFDAVLLTPPAPQSQEILQASGLATLPLFNALSCAEYHRQFTFSFGLEDAPQRPGTFHALINLDGKNPVAWISFENDKPGHIPDGVTVVGVQMQPNWSREHFEEDAAELSRIAWSHAATVLQWNDCQPQWFDSQRWKFAHPVRSADMSLIQSHESKGLFIAGDALIGKGRVNRALETGVEVAERIDATLRS